MLLIGPLAAQPTASHSVYKSHDQGHTWTRSDNGLPGNARINAFGAAAGAVFAGTDAGIFVSRDAAKTWRRTGSPVRVISFAMNGQIIYAGTAGDGLHQSLDNGATWARNENLSASNIRSLLAEGGKVYAGTDRDGVFVLTGLGWNRMGNGLPAGAQIFALAAVNHNLFAALYAKGLYKWEEREQRWIRTGSVTPLALAATNGTLLAGHNPGGIHASIDLGRSWSPVPQQDIKPIWELASNGGIAFTGAADGVFYSKNQGQTWLRASAGLPAASPGVAFLDTGDFALASIIVRKP